MVIHKSLRDFRPLWYSSRDGHAEGEHVNRGRDTKKTWRDSLPIDTLLSAVSVLVVAQPSSEVPEGLMNYLVLTQKQQHLDSRCVNNLEARIPQCGHKTSIQCADVCYTGQRPFR